MSGSAARSPSVGWGRALGQVTLAGTGEADSERRRAMITFK
jgi:hypothetical protein